MNQVMNVRDAAIEATRNLLQEKDKAVILDTETTGLGGGDVAVQVSVIDLEAHVLLNTLVNTDVPIGAKAQEIHGITSKMIADYPGMKELLPELERVLTGKIVIVYNAAYDSRILRQSLARAGVAPEYKLPCEYYCAMELYSEFVGEWDSYHGNYRWQRLPSGDHSALGDCRATLAILQKMAQTTMSTDPVEDTEAV